MTVETEYDVDEETLMSTLDLAEFPILGANVLMKNSDQNPSYVQPIQLFINEA